MQTCTHKHMRLDKHIPLSHLVSISHILRQHRTHLFPCSPRLARFTHRRRSFQVHASYLNLFLKPHRRKECIIFLYRCRSIPLHFPVSTNILHFLHQPFRFITFFISTMHRKVFRLVPSIQRLHLYFNTITFSPFFLALL